MLERWSLWPFYLSNFLVQLFIRSQYFRNFNKSEQNFEFYQFYPKWYEFFLPNQIVIFLFLFLDKEFVEVNRSVVEPMV